jgi:hypothetical protein
MANLEKSKGWNVDTNPILLSPNAVDLDPEGLWIRCRSDNVRITTRHPFAVGRLKEHNR